MKDKPTRNPGELSMREAINLGDPTPRTPSLASHDDSTPPEPPEGERDLFGQPRLPPLTALEIFTADEEFESFLELRRVKTLENMGRSE